MCVTLLCVGFTNPQSQPFQDDIPACPFVGVGKLGGVGARKMIPTWTLVHGAWVDMCMSSLSDVVTVYLTSSAGLCVSALDFHLARKGSFEVGVSNCLSS